MNTNVTTEQARYERLMQPSSMFRIFVPNEEKIKLFSDKLLHEYLYLSDEFREPQRIYGLLQVYLSGIASIFYELPKFGGLIGFINIIPEYKAEITFKLWDRTLWGPTFLRELRDLTGMMMNELRLIRLYSNTPDEKMERMAHLCGFKTECAQKYGFRWNGRYYPLKLLAKTRAIKGA
jgi:hypothetical protein